MGLATWSQTSNSVIQGFGFFSLWPTAGRILVAGGGRISCSGVGLLPDSEQTQVGSAGVGRKTIGWAWNRVRCRPATVGRPSAEG